MKFPDRYRQSSDRLLPQFRTQPGDPYGLFIIPGRDARGRALQVVAAGDYQRERDGEVEGFGESQPWEHVSVTVVGDKRRPCPSWEEMAIVKDLFWDDHEVVMQLHVPAIQHINNHPGCLHLWRPTHVDIPLPPSWMVGIRTEPAPESAD